MSPQVISLRWIVMGIVGIFLTGWLVFAITAPRDPIIGSYTFLGFSEDEHYVFRSDGSFLRLDGARQLAAGRWDLQRDKEIQEPWRGGKLVPAREYSLLTEAFEPGQHTPDRVFLVVQRGYLLIDGIPHYPATGWLEQIKLRFLNWIQ